MKKSTNIHLNLEQYLISRCMTGLRRNFDKVFYDNLQDNVLKKEISTLLFKKLAMKMLNQSRIDLHKNNYMIG